MKFTVKIDHQKFEVEVNDVRQRPIIVLVDGEPFEVYPEDEHLVSQPHQGEPRRVQNRTAQPAAGKARVESGSPIKADNNGAPAAGAILTSVRAPIPGVITAVNVQVGTEVNPGDPLCVLEAMKMNNSIRSSRHGKISAVYVSVGQHVKHHDVLVEFAE